MTTKEEIDWNHIEERIKTVFIEKIVLGKNIPEKDQDQYIKIMERKYKESHQFAFDITQKSIFLPKTIEMAGSGINQLVLQLDDKFVLKLHKMRETNNYFYIAKHTSHAKNNYAMISEFKFPVPESFWYDMKFGDNGNFVLGHNTKMSCQYFIISKDLKENGKYTIEEFNTNTIKDMKNKDALQKEFNIYKDKLMDIYNGKDKNIGLDFNSHVKSEGNPINAIRHVFLLQKNIEYNTGKIYAADFDHLEFYWK